MKISELQELLEKAKEEYGDIEVVVKHYESSTYIDEIYRVGNIKLNGNVKNMCTIVVN